MVNHLGDHHCNLPGFLHGKHWPGGLCLFTAEILTAMPLPENLLKMKLLAPNPGRCPRSEKTDTITTPLTNVRGNRGSKKSVTGPPVTQRIIKISGSRIGIWGSR